ncbi:MAG TPA: Yip1 family protein [Phenylobacterium sp.]|uniref:Yip1 family protein n=1 Tax=Phenylobacterium sp. TaxID=1871053 RepID=UPI002D3AB4EA|nr:Yip1 family protein [Phenylobacterium sp.]HZZ67675.1 Yip1 family protein [Phenylobacterium sp.]
MSVADAPSPHGLIQRATNILLHPKAEWDAIAAEPATTQSIFIYAAILAGVAALARLAHGLMPFCFFVACYTPNPVFAVISSIVYYIVTLAGVFVVGLIIDALATGFGGEKNQVQAMKAAVYSWTAAWLAGVFIVVPWFGWLLSLVGLYSIYLLYVGLPRTMKSPEQQAVGYTAVVVILAIVVFVIGGAIAGTVATMGALSGAAASGSISPVTGTVHFGNGGSLDLDKLRAAGQQAEAQIKAQQQGGPNKVVAVDPERLKALLPDSVAGAARTDVSATSAGAAGYGASNAEATYQNGNARITLKITDLAAAGSFAAMASAFNVQTDEQTSTGYKKVSTVGGMLVTEKYDNQSKSGEYTVIVANRFAIEADGDGVGMDALKAAVAAIGPDRVAALAHG